MKEEIIVKIIDAILKDSGEGASSNKTQYDQFIGKFVLARHHMMGVNCGYLDSPTKEGFYLLRGRKFWHWNCSEGVALESFAKKIKVDGTRATAIAGRVMIPTDNLCGIISVDDEDSIKAMLDCPVSHQD